MHSMEATLTSSARALDITKVLYLGDLDSHPDAPTCTTEPVDAEFANHLMFPPRSLADSANALLKILSDFSRPATAQEHILPEAWKDRDIQSRLVDSIYRNKDLWRKYSDTGGSLWMRFISQTMRYLIPDASFASSLSCSHTDSDCPTRLLISRTLSQDHTAPLPILCMTDDNLTIVPMVHAALTHYKQAGLYHSPVIGLLLPRSGKHCHVLLGWLSKPACSGMSSQQGTDEVYLVIPDYPNTSQPRGVFDLTTFDGARVFALFLEQCGAHIASPQILPHMEKDQESVTQEIAEMGSGGSSARVLTWQEDMNGGQALDLPLAAQTGFFPEGIMIEEHLLASVVRKLDRNTLLMEKAIWSDDDESDEILAVSDTDLDNQLEDRPGILEWSLDHHLCTLPFVSRLGGDIHTKREKHLDVLRNLLGYGPKLMTPEEASTQRPSNSDSLCAVGRLDLPGGCDDEVLAILIPEIGWLCCSKGHCTCWQTSWRETARRCVLAGSQESGAPFISFTGFGHINFSRCPEYDQRIISESAVARPDYSHADRPNNDLFPYAPLWGLLEKCNELLEEARKAATNSVGAYWDADELQQMDGAINHIRQLESAILNDRNIFSSNASPKEMRVRTACIGSIMRQFKSRIRRYPLEDTVDGAVTVVVKDFCRTLEAHISSNPDLLDNFLFFKSLDDDSADVQYHLPVLLMEHQEEDRELRAATNNIQRMHCTSAVRFLAALGIKDFPVYGLSTYRSHGSLCQTWYSEEDNCCYIVDQIPAKYHFDIGNKDGIIHYIAFLDKMKAHAEELRSRFESVRESVVEKLSTNEGRESLQWTLHAQVKEYKL